MANKFSQRTLEWAIIICFYLNIAFGVGFFEASKWILSNDSQAFFFATGHPLSRVTIFFMGICGALLSTKKTSSPKLEIERENENEGKKNCFISMRRGIFHVLELILKSQTEENL